MEHVISKIKGMEHANDQEYSEALEVQGTSESTWLHCGNPFEMSIPTDVVSQKC